MPKRGLGFLGLMLGLTACGGDSLGSVLGALDGRYRLTTEDDCFIVVSGSSVRTETSSGAAVCSRVGLGDFQRETLEVNGTLSGSSLTATVVIRGETEYEDWDVPGCFRQIYKEHVFEGTAERTKSGSASGRWASIAGTWRASATRQSVQGESPVQGCTFEPFIYEPSRADVDFDARAIIDGDTAAVEYTSTGEPAPRSFFVDIIGNDAFVIQDNLVTIE